MRHLKLTIAYDGTDFSGWQIQPNQRTVQETFELALMRITGERQSVVASGRTDAGVHALGQVLSLRSRSQLSCQVLRRALNANLPSDIAVLEVTEAAHGFHAIRDATRKRYRYQIQNSPVPDVFTRKYSWHLPTPLDVDRMRCASCELLGTHDFQSFETAGAERISSVRTIHDLTVSAFDQKEGRRIEIEVEANGFLYNMVRTIVGSLVEVGRGKRPEAWLAQVLEAKDRRLAGPTAPPQGLVLVSVKYETPLKTED